MPDSAFLQKVHSGRMWASTFEASGTGPGPANGWAWINRAIHGEPPPPDAAPYSVVIQDYHALSAQNDPPPLQKLIWRLEHLISEVGPTSEAESRDFGKWQRQEAELLHRFITHYLWTRFTIMSEEWQRDFDSEWVASHLLNGPDGLRALVERLEDLAPPWLREAAVARKAQDLKVYDWIRATLYERLEIPLMLGWDAGNRVWAPQAFVLCMYMCDFLGDAVWEGYSEDAPPMFESTFAELDSDKAMVFPPWLVEHITRSWGPK